MFNLYDSKSNMNCGGFGKIKSFLSINPEDFISSLNEFVNDLGFEVSKEQMISWQDCYEFLRKKFKGLIELNDNYKNFYIAFEYYLPMEGGRRPDLLLFSKNKLIIFEFKRKNNYMFSDIEQAIGYKRDIKNYHKESISNNLNVEAYLILTKSSKKYNSKDGIKILTRSTFIKQVDELDLKTVSKTHVNTWLDSKYEPLLSIAKSTLNLFRDNGLPQIKNIEEGQIADTLDYLKRVIYENEIKNHGKRLVLVSGVPGSGKTLVGLKLLYDYNLYKVKELKETLSAIYLSGNGPLVSVLQSILSDETGELGKTGKTYIRGVKNYKYEYMHSDKVPLENVIIFDEAQRAWDKNKMKENISEAELLLKIGDRIYNKKNNITIICFVGDGQSIYKGEEKGVKLWDEALMKSQNWELYFPGKYKILFKENKNVKIKEKLNLTHSIRNHFIDINIWIEALIKDDFQKAKKALEKIRCKGFFLRITREFKKAQKYVKNKEKRDKDITYGLLVYSKVKKIEVQKHLKQKYLGNYMRKNEIGEWYKGASKEFTKAASEFDCQGLELDYTIVYFGGNYYYEKSCGWKVDDNLLKKNKSDYEDFNKIVENVYRVLLSRGREGMVLYIPKLKKLDQTYKLLKELGIKKIK